MTLENSSPPLEWIRYLPWGRILLRLAALACGWLLEPKSALWALITVGLLLIFSLLVPLRRKPDGPFELLVLFGDVVFFLVLASASMGVVIKLPFFSYLFVAAEAVALYNPREVLIVTVVSFLFCAAVPLPLSRDLTLATVVVGILGYGFAIYRKRVESRISEIERAAGEVRDDARRAREMEKQRIASDFHDGPLQSFISLQMRLEILRKVLERDHQSGLNDLYELQKLATQQVKELRAFVRSMRPMDLEGANLFASARRVCESFQKESGIPVTFLGGESPPKLTEEVASEVVQMLRESLHNVLKHAGATRVAVSVEQAGKMLDISVDDNGRGFHFSGVYTLDELELLRLGPASLKRRARGLNAEMILESRPGRGAGMKLRVPIP